MLKNDYCLEHISLETTGLCDRGVILWWHRTDTNWLQRCRTYNWSLTEFQCQERTGRTLEPKIARFRLRKRARKNVIHQTYVQFGPTRHHTSSAMGTSQQLSVCLVIKSIALELGWHFAEPGGSEKRSDPSPMQVRRNSSENSRAHTKNANPWPGPYYAYRYTWNWPRCARTNLNHAMTMTNAKQRMENSRAHSRCIVARGR